MPTVGNASPYTGLGAARRPRRPQRGTDGLHLLRLIEPGPDVLEVDLAELRYLSPAGYAALFTALRATRARGTRLIITHPSHQAGAVMRRIGLTYALTHRQAGTE